MPSSQGRRDGSQFYSNLSNDKNMFQVHLEELGTLLERHNLKPTARFGYVSAEDTSV
ncbi:MAG: hypothetical protein QXY52_00410 [Conexivisphaerales archaeon]